MKKKLEYIWDYYKLHMIGIAIVIIILISVIQGYVNKKNPILYIGFINTSFQESIMTELGDSFIDSIQGNSDDCCYFYTNLVLTSDTTNGSYEYSYASEMKLLAAIESKEFDLAIVNKEVLDAMDRKEYLYDLSSLFPDAYQTKTTGIDISNVDFLASAGINDPAYLCVIANTPRTDMVKQYIDYLCTKGLEL